MRAKELATRFQATPTAECAAAIALELVKETGAIAKGRGIQSNSALLAILREQDQKWRAFARLCPEVAPEGFHKALHRLLPDTVTLFPFPT